MNFTRTKIADVVICEPTVYRDERGYFCETFREDKLNDFLGFNVNFCQDNESKSSKGVLRGLHYQLPPYAQSKLVRVIEGSVLDIAVDIRKDSPTFLQSVSVELSGENKKQLFIPRGFAHAFVVLEDNTTFAYKVDNYYNAQSERGIIYSDSTLAINWNLPNEELIVSQKDTILPTIKNAIDLFNYQDDLYHIRETK